MDSLKESALKGGSLDRVDNYCYDEKIGLYRVASVDPCFFRGNLQMNIELVAFFIREVSGMGNSVSIANRKTYVVFMFICLFASVRLRAQVPFTLSESLPAMFADGKVHLVEIPYVNNANNSVRLIRYAVSPQSSVSQFTKH